VKDENGEETIVIRSETDKEHIKKELRKLFRSMDFVSNKFLADEKAAGKDFKMYFNIYQQLGLAHLPQFKNVKSMITAS